MDLEEIEFFLMECEWREDEDEEEVESSIRSWRQQTQHSQSLAISDTQMLLLMWGQNPSTTSSNHFFFISFIYLKGLFHFIFVKNIFNIDIFILFFFKKDLENNFFNFF
jgi:hypothetical protein